ncbi:neurogenic locus notch homolog protein 2-like [Saccostrea echinata]|uniref:neurogenic locus notch homolog protein 2-like n=1 Tax=Saccostrea echinata TaxID=191078 RepID=UPI002A80D4D2|nr:neurogenic locus notch homolog protein 2-like [Saccostrea echinata]
MSVDIVHNFFNWLSIEWELCSISTDRRFRKSTTALSSIPLQFIVTVTSDGACYLEPNFTSPTPAEGTVIQVYNGSLQFKARASITFSDESITKFHILSPLDFTISDISNPVLYEYETTISLTEITAEEIGIHVLCFSAESNYRRSTISRCIRVNITDIVDNCFGDPCQNSGTCVDLTNDYRCQCLSGFTDKNCSTNINECMDEPCENNGTCVDLINNYECQCVPGFNGSNCEENIDECAESPCPNNGTCEDLINDYNCSCVPGFNGTNCEESK